MSKPYHCPHCQTEILWNENFPYRPFCSKRCKLIDLGDWASEAHKIPASLVEYPDDFLELESDNKPTLN